MKSSIQQTISRRTLPSHPPPQLPHPYPVLVQPNNVRMFQSPPRQHWLQFLSLFLSFLKLFGLFKAFWAFSSLIPPSRHISLQHWYFLSLHQRLPINSDFQRCVSVSWPLAATHFRTHQEKQVNHQSSPPLDPTLQSSCIRRPIPRPVPHYSHPIFLTFILAHGISRSR